MATLWSSELNKTILEQIKLAEWDCDYMLEFFKTEKLYTKNLFQKQLKKRYKFHIKIYWNHLYNLF